MYRKTGIVFALLTAMILSGSLTAFGQGNWRINREKGTGDLISVFFTSEDDGWVAGDDGYLAYTRDGGRSWNKKVLNTAANINEIYFRNDDDGYLVAGRKMFITKDGGLNWRETLIVDPGTISEGTPEFLSIRFNSRNQGFIIGSVLSEDESVVDSLLLRTTDGGESWTRVLLPDVKTELFHLDFDGKQEGWIVGDMGVILATTNNGTSWTLQESGTTAGLYNVDFRNDHDGFVVGEEGTVLRTTNGGRTWQRVNNGVKKTLFRVNQVDSDNVWIVGGEGTILRSQDGGNTWLNQPSNTTSSLYGLYMDKKYGWSVGKGGIIMKYSK
ncbi:MAG: YCF48-related protein [Pyrinomonadaceae bacterium]